MNNAPLGSKQDRLLNAGLHLLAEGGIPALTAGRLAQTAGVSKSLVFHHFGTMDEVPRQLLVALGQELVEAFRSVQGDNLKDYLNRLGQTFLVADRTQEVFDRALFHLIQQALAEPSLLALVQHLTAEVLTEVAGRLKPWVEDPISLAHVLTSLLDGLGTEILTGGDPVQVRRAWACWESLVLGGLT